MCRFLQRGAMHSGLNDLNLLLDFGEFQCAINQGHVDMGMKADGISSQHPFLESCRGWQEHKKYRLSRGHVQKKPIFMLLGHLAQHGRNHEMVIIVHPHLIPWLSDIGERLGELALHMAIDWPPTASNPWRDLPWGA